MQTSPIDHLLMCTSLNVFSRLLYRPLTFGICLSLTLPLAIIMHDAWPCTTFNLNSFNMAFSMSTHFLTSFFTYRTPRNVLFYTWSCVGNEIHTSVFDKKKRRVKYSWITMQMLRICMSTSYTHTQKKSKK